MSDRRAQLKKLEAKLMALVDILHLDPRCQWTRHFESCLSDVRLLLAGNLNQSEINELSGSVTYVFGGMGSFNDYASWQNGRPIPGMERLTEAAGDVYQSALALRAVEA